MAELTRPGLGAAPAAPGHERGLRLIIAYKVVRGCLWLAFALVLGVLTASGLGGELLEVAAHLRRHAGAWSVELANLVTTAATGERLWVVVVALVCDATLTLVEAWALHTRRAWGEWLVVVTTGSLLPFEVVAFVRHLHVERALVLVVNLIIVAYLVRAALRKRRAEKAEAATAPAP